MRPGHALALASLTSAALIASPAHALSDLVPFTPAGWSTPVPVRTVGDATGSAAADSPVLVGEVPSFMSRAVRNSGTTSVLVAPTNQILVDGVVRHTAVSTLLPPGITTFVNNVPITVSGGLHSVGALADATNAEAESNELNNEFGRQLSFTPANLALGAIATRSAPPLKRAGTSAIVGTVYDNQDGLRLPANELAWEAVALRPPVGQDYDLSLYDATTALGNGFRTPLKTSTLGTGATDFILNNGNFVGAPPHDIGITNFSGAAVDYSVEHRQSNGVFLNSGNTYAGLTLAANQMLAIHTFQHVPNAAVSRMLITLTGTPGQVLHVALFDPSATYANRNDAIADVAMDATGKAYLDRALETVGSPRQYGLVVYRDQTDGGTAPATYSLRIRPTPADLSNAQEPGYTKPMNAGNAGFDWTTDPVELNGDSLNTRVSLYFSNTGALLSGPFSLSVRRDGIGILDIPFGSIDAGGFFPFGFGVISVPGGRHTLSYVTDAGNVIDETSEDNNTYGRQFVWSPLRLNDGQALTRPLPPDASGGRQEVPASETFYLNCDGFRSPVIFPSDSRVMATAVLPGGNSDVDLYAHDASTGPLDGFAAVRAFSQQGAHLTDMIAVTRELVGPTIDFGVVRFSGTSEPYTIESVLSDNSLPRIGTLPQSTIAPGHLIKAFLINPGNVVPFYVGLENLAGGADLGVSVFPFKHIPDEVRGMTQVATGGFADAKGPGGSEICTVTEPTSAVIYGAVVWKKGTDDLNKSATFRLSVTRGLLGVTPPEPRVTSFALATANPLRTSTQLRYTLAAESNVSLDVLDLQGRLVRSLVGGREAAGEHSAEWDGTDASGMRVANGAYFVRFAAAGYQRTLKLAVLR